MGARVDDNPLAVNDAFIAVNRLLRSGEAVYWLRSAYTDGGTWPAGSHYVRAGESTLFLNAVEELTGMIALHEALVNAIQHGNLELSSDLRQEDERAFQDLGEQRRRQPPYKDRRVRVRATLSRSEAVYVIEDEGPGFDPSTLPDPTDPANLERVGGRGLMLIRTFMDEVEHNQTGNRITLRKRSGNRR